MMIADNPGRVVTDASVNKNIQVVQSSHSHRHEELGASHGAFDDHELLESRLFNSLAGS